MKLDTSVAPEIALLAAGLRDAAHHPGTSQDSLAGTTGPFRAGPATVGTLARCLQLLATDPRAWWDLVQFDPERPVRVAVGAPAPGCEAWLLVLPPGYHGNEPEPGQDGEVVCLVAGAITELAGLPGRRRGCPLPSGRIRVRGGREPRLLVNTGCGYAVSLHARPASGRPVTAGPAA